MALGFHMGGGAPATINEGLIYANGKFYGNHGIGVGCVFSGPGYNYPHGNDLTYSSNTLTLQMSSANSIVDGNFIAGGVGLDNYSTLRMTYTKDGNTVMLEKDISSLTGTYYVYVASMNDSGGKYISIGVCGVNTGNIWDGIREVERLSVQLVTIESIELIA